MMEGKEIFEPDEDGEDDGEKYFDFLRAHVEHIEWNTCDTNFGFSGEKKPLLMKLRIGFLFLNISGSHSPKSNGLWKRFSQTVWFSSLQWHLILSGVFGKVIIFSNHTNILLPWLWYNNHRRILSGINPANYWRWLCFLCFGCFLGQRMESILLPAI